MSGSLVQMSPGRPLRSVWFEHLVWHLPSALSLVSRVLGSVQAACTTEQHGSMPPRSAVETGGEDHARSGVFVLELRAALGHYGHCLRAVTELLGNPESCLVARR